MDQEKLIKLLMLTTSDNDAEALSAIRHANQLLKRTGSTWAAVIMPAVITVKSPPVEDVRIRDTRAFLDRAGGTYLYDKNSCAFSFFHGNIQIHYYPMTRQAVVDGKSHRWSLSTLVRYMMTYPE
jgi:hypothetical protein